MAMFHFRLKSDKKPNETKIQEVKHAGYIDHEGSFSDDGHEQEADNFVGNFITTEKKVKMYSADKICSCIKLAALA